MVQHISTTDHHNYISRNLLEGLRAFLNEDFSDNSNKDKTRDKHED